MLSVEYLDTAVVAEGPDLTHPYSRNSNWVKQTCSAPVTHGLQTVPVARCSDLCDGDDRVVERDMRVGADCFEWGQCDCNDSGTP